MSSWACLRCRTVYASGLEKCPQCGYDGDSEGGVVAKVNAAGVATQYVAEGQDVPADLPAGVLLVGPGSGEDVDVPLAEAEVAAPDPGPGPASTPPESSLVSSVLVEDYASQPIRALRELVRERGLPVAGSKAELVARLEEDDRAAVA